MPQLPDLRRVQEYLDEQSWVDMAVYSAGYRSDLVVAMAKDLTYAHEASLSFADPSYFSGPLTWTTSSEGGQALRVLSADERKALPDPDAASAEGFLFELRTDEETTVLIGASAVSIEQALVFYYRRDELKPGERLAYWVE
jgi:hypothetical protein